LQSLESNSDIDIDKLNIPSGVRSFVKMELNLKKKKNFE
jgi:hypothetical protein